MSIATCKPNCFYWRTSVSVFSLILFSFCCACTSTNKPAELVEKDEVVEEDCRNNLRATQGEMNTCAHQTALHSEQELAELLENIERVYPVEFWDQLEANQIEWEALREKDCQLTASFYDGGSMEPMIYSGCINAANLERIRFIKRLNYRKCTEKQVKYGAWNFQ